MFKQAIVKTAATSMVEGISHAGLGLPDYQLAVQQQNKYIEALKACGLRVTVLPAEEQFPDSCFVEDVAVVTPKCVIITRPGAISRRSETQAVEAQLSTLKRPLEYITGDATLDGGDVMMVGTHFYIGLSARTNQAGADQMVAILKRHQLTGSALALEQVLHLKTGLSYLENQSLMVSGEFVGHPALTAFNCLEVSAAESYAANCIWVNGTVIMPAGFPQTQAMLISNGFKVVAVDVSEFEKLDGGLSCLSLRF